MRKRKKSLMPLLAVVVSCMLVFAMMPVSALAAKDDTGTTAGWNWTILEDNTLAVTASAELSGTVGTLTIPDSLDTGEKGPGVLPVTAIGVDAFNHDDYSGVTGIVLPAGLKKIGNYGFVGTGISSITIPAACQSIGEGAFNSTGLASIEFASPSSLQSIGDNAFLSTGLTRVVIPNSVTSIGKGAFSNCTRLESITLPNNSGFTAIRDETFASCSALSSIDIPPSVTSIGTYAFLGAGLENITIPAGITSIGIGVFGHTASLSSVSVASDNANYTSQDGVLYNKAKTELYSCPSGKSGSFVIPDGVTTIKESAFSGCRNLTEITIPSSVTNIDDYAFIYCDNLSKVYIKSRYAIFSNQNVFGGTKLSTAVGGGIYGIAGSSAQTYAGSHKVDAMDTDFIPFHPAYYVVSFNSGNSSELPDAVVDADEAMAAPPEPTFTGYDFGGWYTDSTYATEWNFDDPVIGSMTLYAKWTQGGELYRSGETDHFKWEAVGTELTVTGYEGTIPSSLTIPNTIDTGISGLGTLTVRGIGNEAFKDHYMVTSLTLPSDLVSIGDGAFQGCYDISSVSIPASVETIGESAFEGCNNLGSVTIAGTSRLESIGEYAFCGTGLLSFVMPNSVTSVGAHVFADCHGLVSVTLSNQLEEISDVMFRYCENLTGISIPASVKSIGSNAFLYSGLTSITIPDTVTEIGANAFESCGHLLSATLPDNSSFTAIPDNLFYYCESLATVNFPAHVTAIGDNAFSATGFSDIVIPNTVESIGQNAFSYCNNLENIQLPENASFINISDYLLSGCEKLESIDIPSQVTAIGEGAFCESGLTELTIPSQIISIADWAFSGTQLSEITIPANVASMGSGIFMQCYNLSEINVNPANTHFSSETGVLYNADKTTLLIYPSAKPGAFTVLDGVQTIAAEAFFGCAYLTQVSIPQSVTLIDKQAFIYCGELTKASIKSNDAVFGDNVFFDTDLDSDGIYGIEDSTADAYADMDDIPFHIAYCTVMFDSKGGSGVNGLIVDINQGISKPAAPKRTGYDFGGWFKDEGCTQAWDFVSDTVSKNTTLYAKWTSNIVIVPVAISCSVTNAPLYRANGNITITASGGNSGAYLYSVDGGVHWSSINSFNVAAGTYTAAVCDAANIGNIKIQTVVVGQPLYIGAVPVKKMASKPNAGTALTIIPPAAPRGYTVVSVTYSSKNPSIATVDAVGHVTFLARGKTMIITTVVSQMTDAKGRVKTKTTTIKRMVTVKQPVSAVSLNLTNTTIARKDKAKLSASIAPASANNKRLTWKSSNPKVASVSSAGVVTGKAGGTAIITCTAKDGSGVSASCIVTVTPIYPTAMKLSKTALAVKPGKTASLRVAITPRTTDFKTVTWTSSNPAVATVDAKGKVKALSAGSAVIIATTSNGISVLCTVTVS